MTFPEFVLFFFTLLQAFFTVLFFIFSYFISVELWRRHKCKMGFHAGHIKDGKLICHTCFKEVDANEKNN